MHSTDEIASVGVSEQNVRWTEYPAKTCFECRVALLREDDGGYSVYAISLPGVASQGETEKEAIANIVDALSGALAEYKSSGVDIPWSEDFIEDGAIERRVLVNLNDMADAGLMP